MKRELLYNKTIKIFGLINATIIGIMTIMSLTILPYNNLVGITNPGLADFFILYQVNIGRVGKAKRFPPLIMPESIISSKFYLFQTKKEPLTGSF